MELRYHPYTAFTLVFAAGLLTIILALVCLGLIAPDLFLRVTKSGVLIYLPFILTFFAAQQACKGNGPPFVHMLVEDPDALRDHFDKWHVAWTLVYALQATGVIVLMAMLLWLAGKGPSPFENVFMLVVCLVINIVSAYQGIKYCLVPSAVFRPDPDAVEANPAALAAWAVRRMQKKMNEGITPSGKN